MVKWTPLFSLIFVRFNFSSAAMILLQLNCCVLFSGIFSGKKDLNLTKLLTKMSEVKNVYQTSGNSRLNGKFIFIIMHVATLGFSFV